MSQGSLLLSIPRRACSITSVLYVISSAPRIFQQGIADMLQGSQGVVTSLDEIIITGTNEEEHLKSLEEFLELLAKAGLKVKKHKCIFMVPRVSYLGNSIEINSLHP